MQEMQEMRVAGTEEPGGLQSMGLQRHDWATEYITYCTQAQKDLETIGTHSGSQIPSFKYWQFMSHQIHFNHHPSLLNSDRRTLETNRTLWIKYTSDLKTGLHYVRLFAIPWIVACQASLSMELSRQEYWSGLPFPTLGDLLDPGNELMSLVFLALAGGFFTTCATREA